jgi:hypothetical protein
MQFRLWLERVSTTFQYLGWSIDGDVDRSFDDIVDRYLDDGHHHRVGHDT